LGEEIYAGIGNRNTNQKYSANGDDTRKKFATYQRDAETNLDYAQSRYYSPMQGRFTSPDEFKGGPDELFDFEEDASRNPTFYADLENPQSLNKYQYTYNNPYKYNDPNGHCLLALTPALPFCIEGAKQVAVRVAPYVVSAIAGVAIAAASSGNTAGDPSCPACGKSQQMGQSMMNESASSSGNGKAKTASKAVDVKVNTGSPQNQKGAGNKDKGGSEKRDVNKEASKRGGELVTKFKKEGTGQGAGRSGGHGTPYKKAGNQLIQEANKLPKNDPLREALKKEGKRLLNKGNSLNEKIN
jgi:RHS repeat-associated protein